MLDIIQYKDIKKYKKYIPFDINNFSTLYYEKNLINKIPYYTQINFIDILNYIEKCDLDEIIELKRIILDEEKLVGYSFINYKDYKSLRKLANRRLCLKKEDCFKIVSAFKVLSDNHIKYNDYHKGNVLLNKTTGNIKICDIDFVAIRDENFEEEQLRKSLILALAYLYNVDFHDISILLRTGNSINKEQLVRDCINNISIDNIFNLFNKLDLNLIEEERIKIKIKSKELSNTGYYKNDYL